MGQEHGVVDLPQLDEGAGPSEPVEMGDLVVRVFLDGGRQRVLPPRQAQHRAAHRLESDGEGPCSDDVVQTGLDHGAHEGHVDRPLGRHAGDRVEVVEGPPPPLLLLVGLGEDQQELGHVATTLTMFQRGLLQLTPPARATQPGHLEPRPGPGRRGVARLQQLVGGMGQRDEACIGQARKISDQLVGRTLPAQSRGVARPRLRRVHGDGLPDGGVAAVHGLSGE